MKASAGYTWFALMDRTRGKAMSWLPTATISQPFASQRSCSTCFSSRIGTESITLFSASAKISTSAKSSRRRSSTLPTRRSCLTRSKLRFIRVSDILEAKRQTVGSSNKEGGEMLFSLVCLFCFFSLCSLFSKLVARVDRYDAGGQRLEHHLSEARFAHHRRKELRGGKLPDRLHKILIRVGIARNHRTKPRDDIERVGPVDAVQHGVYRRIQPCHGRRELEAHEPPPRSKHPIDLSKRLVLVGDVAQSECDRHKVEGFVLVRDLHRIHHRPLQFLGQPSTYCRLRAAFAHLQHILIDVGDDQPGLLALLLYESPGT
mmetsp:Transcript_674/g.2576  ORF Transcript_674/g.2576 Transcript_674/m.2576 type:complete len:317 (+) Transcript_674:205-1155(+)